MEGSHSEAIFESLNLSPQLFINEVLNIVDDLVDEAFNFFSQEVSALLKTESTDRSDELSKGVAYIRELIQLTIDQRMQKWEEYCLRFCFNVPEGFSLPKAEVANVIVNSIVLYSPSLHIVSMEKNELSGDDLPDLDALMDAEMDAQLNSLRDKLALVGKESAELGRELRALERQSLSSNQSLGSVDEALQLYKQHNATHMFQELATMASEFRAKLGNLKRRRIEEIQCDRAEVLSVKDHNVFKKPGGNGLFGAKLEEFQEFLEKITTTS